jgi:hypothetical protein
MDAIGYCLWCFLYRFWDERKTANQVVPARIVGME